MKSILNKTIVLFTTLAITILLLSWGIFGHEHINKAAVFVLPKGTVQTFFYNHIDFLTQESTIPDLRKYLLEDKNEFPRHFLDIENFGSLDDIPHDFQLAKAKFGETFFQENGTLPWQIQTVMQKLTQAMKEKRKTEILLLAADLGHYIADAHMPLHTSANHNGQLTNQKGIHALWESRIPEIFGKKYNYYTQEEVKYIKNTEQAIWDLMKDTHGLVAPVLEIEKKCRTNFDSKKIYELDDKGNPIKNKYNEQIFSKEYVAKFNEDLNGMVENQLRKTIISLSSFWYTAWINAGKPNLDDLDAREMTKRNQKYLKSDLKMWKKGNLFGLESNKE